MRLIIEISDASYETVKNGTWCGSLYEELKNGTPLSETDDYVSRQAVNDLVDELARAISDERCCISRGRSTATIMQDILDLPSVTPAEKVGQWEWEQESFTKNWGNWHCSECREIITVCETDWAKINKPVYKYCPDCGAKMQEVKNDR